MTQEQLKAMLGDGADEAVMTRVLEAINTEVKTHQDAAKKAEDDLKAANARAAAVEFHSMLDGVLRDKGARSLKAAKAHLDMDALMKSENRQADAEAAVAALVGAEDTAFLFGAQPTGQKVNVGAGVGKAPAAADGVEAAFARMNPGLKLD